jgi:hypothetical protein
MLRNTFSQHFFWILACALVAVASPAIRHLWNNVGERTNEMSFSYENGHDSPWETIIEEEKVIAFSYKIVVFR